MESFTDEEKERLAKLQSGEIDITINKKLEETEEARRKVDALDEEDSLQSNDLVKVTYVAENYKTFLEKIPV